MWNRHALLHPAVRRFLDVVMRMPGTATEASEAVRRVMPDVEALLLRSAEAGMELGGYDRDVAEAVAFALASVVESKCVGLVPGDPVYDHVLAGAVVGVGVGSGGLSSYGRYLKRFGAISKLVATGFQGVAEGLYGERLAFNASLDGAGAVDARRALSLPEGVGPSRRDLALREALPIPDLDFEGASVRRASVAGQVVLHGLDLFVALGYQFPHASLSRFVARDGDFVVVASFPDVLGRVRPTNFLTLDGVLNVIFLMSPRMAKRNSALRMVTSFVRRLIPGRALEGDEALRSAASSAVGSLGIALRRAAVLRAEVDRHRGIARAAAAEAGELRERLDQVDADRVLPARLAAVARENATLREELDRERRARRMVDKDLEVARGEARRWRAEVEHVVMNGPREALRLLAEPDDGGVH